MVVAQVRAFWIFWGDDDLFGPVLITWVSGFGGSLYAPVLQYYFKEIGASPVDMGNISSLKRVAAMVLAPAYGWLMDRDHALFSMVLCACGCAVGCLVQAIAWDLRLLYVGAIILGLGNNMWSLVLAFVTSRTEPSVRSVVVSGFYGQQRIIELVGKALYSPMRYVIVNIFKVDSKLQQFRMVLSVCWLFCFYGVIRLLWQIARDKKRSQENRLASRTSSGMEDISEICAVDHEVSHGPQEDGNFVSFFGVALAVISLSSTSAAVDILWPMFLQVTFGWDSKEYGVVLLLTTAANITGLTLSPVLEKHLSQLYASCLMMLGVGISAALAFGSDPPHTPAIHVPLVVALAFFLGIGESSLKSLATLQMPRYLQGRTWGVLSSLQGLGVIIGSSGGGLLFRKESSSPFLFNAVGAIVASVFLYVVSYFASMKQLHHIDSEYTAVEMTERKEVEHET
mmetsp:Transcript_11234/g.18329  ORF Transcript_11234/g.18329 Transcript_11234/m.18329 type:complete len:454 (+) Transcript_11234:457-1818(+)